LIGCPVAVVLPDDVPPLLADVDVLLAVPDPGAMVVTLELDVPPVPDVGAGVPPPPPPPPQPASASVSIRMGQWARLSMLKTPSEFVLRRVADALEF
jgi:hypothetical protein